MPSARLRDACTFRSRCSAVWSSLAEHAAHQRRREAPLDFHSCLACFMCLDCTHQTVLHHSLGVQTSGHGHYHSTAAGWLMLLWHHALRRLRTALPSGVAARPAFGVLQFAGIWPECQPVASSRRPSPHVVMFSRRLCCSESQSGQRLRPHLATELTRQRARPQMAEPMSAAERP
jgi:hypothetical protein